MSTAVYLYAAFIADGYLYEVEETDDRAESPDYWLSLKLSETDATCAACDASGKCKACGATCGACAGTGSVTRAGEAFTVFRYGPFSEERGTAIQDAIEEGGDGYIRASILARECGEGTEVCTWEPDDDQDAYDCPTCEERNAGNEENVESETVNGDGVE